MMKHGRDLNFGRNLLNICGCFIGKNGFEEVETSVLMHSATGANAEPYKTHNNALDLDLVLRISHELPLKTLVVGGYDKVFEIGEGV